jgi:hypothetical protein
MTSDLPSNEQRPDASTPALLSGVPGVAGAALATCGSACAGACAPSLLGVLGLSGSGAVLSWVGWLRPVFILVSAVSLGLAFYRAYRRSPPPSSGGPRRFVQSRRFVWMMTAVTLCLFALPYGVRILHAAPPPSPCAKPCPYPRTGASPCNP